MENVAVAKEKKEIALNGSLKDTVQRYDSCSFRHGESDTISFPRLKQIFFQRNETGTKRQWTIWYQSIRQKRQASLLQVDAEKV